MDKYRLYRKQWAGWVIAAAVLGLFLLRWHIPEREPTAIGLQALLDGCFAVSMLGVVGTIAAGLGYRLLRLLSVSPRNISETFLFSLALGLGGVAYGVLLLGASGHLNGYWIAGWLSLAAVVGGSDVLRLAGKMGKPSKWLGLFRYKPLWKRCFWCGVILLGVLTLLQSLTPPWDNDGLMYHLAGPRQFLEAGRIILLPDIWGANGPFTVEMLFTIGLSVGSDVFARLVHLLYACLLVWAIFSFGKRFSVNKHIPWMAAGIVLGIPIFPVWATLSYIDMAWALYEFLGFYAFMLWQQDESTHWLAVSGLSMGLAMGSKYPALLSAFSLGLWILARTWRTKPKNLWKHGWIYGATSLGVASPWFVKNWLLGGNPLYPLVWGGVGWSAQRLEFLMTYLYSFGAGRQPLDFLTIIWDLYAQHERFATFLGTIEMPSLLFPLCLLYPMVKKANWMRDLMVWTLLRFVLWGFGTLQTRFLLPLFPALSLLTAYVLIKIATRFDNQWLAIRLAWGLVGGTMIATIVYAGLYFVLVKPVGVVVGAETKSEFLVRMLSDYAAKQYIQLELPEDARVLLVWNGRSYYCDQRCVPDTTHSQWTQLALENNTVSSLAVTLKEAGVTHLLFDLEDADFILQHDPNGNHQAALAILLEEFIPRCGREIYKDRWTRLYAISCSQ